MICFFFFFFFFFFLSFFHLPLFSFFVRPIFLFEQATGEKKCNKQGRTRTQQTKSCYESETNSIEGVDEEEEEDEELAAEAGG